MKWLDQTPMLPLLIVSILLVLAPFSPEPHVIEKLRMLSRGELNTLRDIFDLLLHGAPLALVVIKLYRRISGRSDDNDSSLLLP